MLLLRFVLLVSVYLGILTTLPNSKTVDAAVYIGPNDATSSDVTSTNGGTIVDDIALVDDISIAESLTTDKPAPDGATNADDTITYDDSLNNDTVTKDAGGDDGILLVRFADPVPQQRPSESEDLDIAHMQASQMTMQDTMALVCDGLPRYIRGCSGVLPFSEYVQLHGSRFVGVSVGRKRRFASSWFGSPGYSSNTGLDHDPFFSFGSPSYHPGNTAYRNPSLSYHPGNTLHTNPTVHPGGQSYGSNTFFGSPSKNVVSNNSRVIICPNPANQSAIYQLSPDDTNYPAVAIGTELVGNPVLLACLLREVVLDTTPPIPAVEDFRMTANATCPFTERRLAQFQSLTSGTMCFVLQNFGDFVRYRDCTERFCRNCTTKASTVPKYRYDSYGNRFVVGYTTQQPSNLNQKLCLTDYRATSLWAYCPALPAGARIVRERIILPLACQCQTVRCEPAPNPHPNTYPHPQPHTQRHPNPYPNPAPHFDRGYRW
ncbi:hypothetical protein V1264_004679 [Littorina saxatilis]|uniref:Uncharacterized protein n=1 Tax=Littorina saxatilis TaxID=31220 RepID=A0AAN9G8H9_9CAEN